MKPEEIIANRFLATRFGEKPIYEPLGRGSPPDFCIGRVAFEVRRLNQQYFRKDGTAEALEVVEYALERAVSQKLGRIPFSEQMGSFFWGLTYHRPLVAKVGPIAKELALKASWHYSSGLIQKRGIEAFRVKAELIPATKSYGSAFVLGYESDVDAGGWARDLYPDNIRFVLKEKIEKTRSVVAKFDRWVLVLVDRIMPGTSWPADSGPLSLDLEHFNSILIINPNGSLAMEWPAEIEDASLRPTSSVLSKPT